MFSLDQKSLSDSAKQMSVVTLPRIKACRAYTAAAAEKGSNAAGSGAASNSGDYHDVKDSHWIQGNLPLAVDLDPSTNVMKPDGEKLPIANPMSGHVELYRRTRNSWGIGVLGTVVVEVEAEDGTKGYGCSIGGEPAAYIVEKHLSRFVEGQRPSSVELIHDQMSRATLNYGRKGVAIQALSAVDIAIWDLLGKLRNAPVMELLGGPVRQALPVYMTTSRPDVAKANGFVGAKIPLPFGPSAGDEGLRRNVEYVAGWREKLGPDFPLALDCYMALNAPYTIKLAKRLEHLNIKWIEEFCPPDDYDGYRRAREAIPGHQLLSAGEHEYTLLGFEKLIQTGIDIIQPDCNWCGGITTYRKVVALAEARGGSVIVVPHGSSVYSYHAQMASVATPIAEFINVHPDGTGVQSFLSGVLMPGQEPLPIPAGSGHPLAGHITAEQLRQRPGFGVDYDLTKLVRPYPRTEQEVRAQFERNANPPPMQSAGMPF